MSLSKMSSLSKLPSEVLACVLNNRALPLCHRLRLRLLCNRWCDIIEDGLKKESALVIREKDAYYRNCKPNNLLIIPDVLTDEIIATLVRLFPAPIELTLVLGSWSTCFSRWDKVPSLLAHWATNLTTVKLYGYIHSDVIQLIADALIAISGLTSLALHGESPSCDLMPLIGPVLSRLGKLVCPDYTDYLDYDSVSSLRCTHLLLTHDIFVDLPASSLTQLSTSLTHLQLQSCDKIDWQFLSQMHGLTSLALELYSGEEYPILESSIFPHFAPFPRLTELKLFEYCFIPPLALPSKKEKPLRGIKNLILELHIDEDLHVLQVDLKVDYQTFCQTLSAWFPDLSNFTLITEQIHFPAIRASLGQLPFSVDLLDLQSVKTWSPDW